MGLGRERIFYRHRHGQRADFGNGFRISRCPAGRGNVLPGGTGRHLAQNGRDEIGLAFGPSRKVNSVVGFASESRISKVR